MGGNQYCRDTFHGPPPFTVEFTVTNCQYVQDRPPALFNLLNYSITKTIEESETVYTFTNSSGSPARLFVSVVNNEINFRLSPTLQDLNPTVFVVVGKDVIVNFGSRALGIGFQINVLPPDPLDVSFSPFRIYESLGQSFRVPSTVTIPNIEVRALASPDGKQLCELDFRIVYYDKCDNIVESNYTQYCINFPSVLKGKGCTLEDKVLSLIAPEEVSSFLQYMLIRYILSGIMRDEFSVCWLRQKYTQSFLEWVKSNQFKVFLSYLDPTFAQYFIC